MRTIKNKPMGLILGKALIANQHQRRIIRGPVNGRPETEKLLVKRE